LLHAETLRFPIVYLNIYLHLSTVQLSLVL